MCSSRKPIKDKNIQQKFPGLTFRSIFVRVLLVLKKLLMLAMGTYICGSGVLIKVVLTGKEEHSAYFLS